MVKRIIVFSLLLWSFPCLLSAKEIVHVAILPFEIHAPEQVDFLRNKLPELLETQLSNEGISVTLPSPETLAKEEDISGDNQLRSFGEKLGSDFVITGSFNRIGSRFSLDIKAISSSTMRLSHHFYVEGEGLENLLDRVQKLAKQISNKIFERKKIVRITIVGNKRIESEAIKKIIKAKEEGLFSKKELSDDLKRIYSMGYFNDIRVEATDIPGGKAVTFRVKEKPIIRHIKIKGNIVLTDDKIKEALDIKTGSILNIHKVYNNIEIIEGLYKEKGYHNVRVTFKTESLKEDRANLVFAIAEGAKALIKEIIFEGNDAYNSDHLQGLMKTSEKGFFSWLTSSGELNQEVLDQDITKIAAYYHNNGYIQAKVAEPHITFADDHIYIKIKIEEGLKFGLGKVSMEGDLIKPEDELLSLIAINKEKIYNREVIRKDILTLLDVYSDAGYAYADVVPRINEDPARQKVDIAYTITQGQPVYFEKIIITGNTKTRDKVIRRELKVYEQELFRGKRLKQGSRNLYRLDYFEDIKVNTSKGSGDDKMNLHIDVKEKPTGAFSVGGGYSSVDDLFFMTSISQRNLFGRGQTLILKASTGKRTTLFNLGFTEPWLFDIPLSAGFDLYNQERDYDTYDKKSVGGRLRFGYRITDYTRTSLYYGYEQADIEDVQDDAAQEIKDMEGEFISSSVTGIVRRDSRDRVFNPTEGSDNSLSVEWAGGPFGGDIAFTKYVAESGWYFPLFWNTVGMLHGKAGLVTENPGGILPVYDRFFLGGMNSVRGFDWRDIGPADPATGDKLGGDKMIQFNAEFLFPLIKDAGLMGLLFFDAGQAYDTGEDINLSDVRESIGYGIRWYSPLGPMRLEYGYILDRKPGENKGRWEFAIGTLF
ncbi:MAG: outer membrane protein assembly factor BamA [Deltaproteobacteria bacterium]|nr:outer membrane protein assembly factor BamA [Deltaproteobacteria bacterium]